MNLALADLANVLGRHVRGLRQHAGRDGQPVEDVELLVAERLVNGPDLASVRRQDLPPRLDDEPRNRVGHQTALPPRYQTGPCVATGFVSDNAWRMRTSAGSSRSSSRSRHRTPICGDVP